MTKITNFHIPFIRPGSCSNNCILQMAWEREMMQYIRLILCTYSGIW